MRIIRFLLDYQCSPIWVYDSNGSLIDNDLPEELKSAREIVSLVQSIEETYDDLFEDTDICFGYRGFSSEEEKQIFFSKVSQVIALLKQKAGNKYQVQIDFNEKDF